MSDNPPEPAPPAEAGTPNAVINTRGGVNLDAQRDINTGGDVIGRDRTLASINASGGPRRRRCTCRRR